MNLRLEKLCLPRHRRDAVWKFWQPNAKLEKIHPPVCWKPLDPISRHEKKEISSTEPCETSLQESSDACHYTSLVYRSSADTSYRIFVDFEHQGLSHMSWKEPDDLSMEKRCQTSERKEVSKPKVRKKSVKPDLIRYARLPAEKEDLFILDSASHLNRPPIDFFHRKYLLPRHLRTDTLRDLIEHAEHAQLHLESIGHFVLHPKDLSKQELDTFDLTVDYGDIYEGHLVRVHTDGNVPDKCLLLLASTHHTEVKLTSLEDLQDVVDDPAHLDARIDPQSTIERLVLEHLREYFETTDDPSLEEVRRVQIEFEAVQDGDRRTVIAHLLTDEEPIDRLTFQISREEDPQLFDAVDEKNLYFLQGIDEKTILYSVEHQLKRVLASDEHDALQKMLHAYAHRRLTGYSRQECMRVALQYSFHDLLDELDSNDFQTITDTEQQDQYIRMMIKEVQTRFHSSVERRRRAEATARILLVGPPMKTENRRMNKEVVLLDRHREIFLPRSDTPISSTRLENTQYNGPIILHEQVEGGPKTVARLPMTTDSLTLLKRLQHRKRLELEQNDPDSTPLGSGTRRLVTSDGHDDRLSIHRAEKSTRRTSSSSDRDRVGEDQRSLRTLATTTKSYNTSADREQHSGREFPVTNNDDQSRKRRKTSRSLAEHGKHKPKRRRSPSSEKSTDRIRPQPSFLHNLLLFQPTKERTTMTNHPYKQDRNLNAIVGIETGSVQVKLNRVRDPEASSSTADHRRSNWTRSSDDQHSSDDDTSDTETLDDEIDDTERYLHALFGSLSSVKKEAEQIYRTKSSQLKSSVDLAQIFITALFLPKDMASEIASVIIAARQRNQPRFSTSRVSKDDGDQESIDLLASKDHFHKHKFAHPSNSLPVMRRMTTYLSEVDWRVFHYLTEHFLQNGRIITEHALRFSSAFLIDLMEESVYQAYFRARWCDDDQQRSKTAMLEDFVKTIVDQLSTRLRHIHLPLLDTMALIHVLKTYNGSNLIDKLSSLDCYPLPIGHDPCLWLSTDILIRMISSLTDDLLQQLRADELSPYTKLEYLLVSYFGKIEIVHGQPSASRLFHPKCLLHVIDWDRAPKFFSERAFQRFQLSKPNQFNGDVEALKDRLLFDLQTRNKTSVPRPCLPLSINDLIVHEHKRVISPSPEILAQCSRRHAKQMMSDDADNEGKDSRTSDIVRTDHLPEEVRSILSSVIEKYETSEQQRILEERMDLDEEVLDLIAKAIAAVEDFDQQHHIGHRKLKNRKIVHERLMEFFKHAGRDGIRLLKDGLELAKLRTNDPKKYMSTAATLLKDRLKSKDPTGRRRQTVRFGHTLETLLMATNDEPALITLMLEKDTLTKPDISRPDASGTSEALDKVAEDEETTVTTEEYPIETSINDQERRSSPMTGKEEHHRVIPTAAPETSLSGLRMAQLAVLLAGQNTSKQQKIKLTNEQLEQICMQQGLSLTQVRHDVTNSVFTPSIPERFELTEEQIVRIAMEEGMSMKEVERLPVPQDRFRLDEQQIRSLIGQSDLVNGALSSTSTSKPTSIPLVLDLNQLIALCGDQQIDMNNTSESIASSDPSQSTLVLSPAQIGHLIHQHKFHLQRLMAIEERIQKQDEATNPFHFTSSQLAYLVSNQRIDQPRVVTGLTGSQLLGLFALQQPASFSLSHSQVEQLALQQKMPLEHLRSLHGSTKKFQLTDDQWRHIIQENQTSIQQIESVDVQHQSTALDPRQLSALVEQNTRSIALSSSADRSRLYLNTEQILSLGKHAKINSDLWSAPETESTSLEEFRFKAEQLAVLRDPAMSLDDRTPRPTSFILTDEQFCSLLGPISSADPNETKPSSDRNRQTPSSRSLTDQLIAVRQQLSSNMQGQIETVKTVSKSILQRTQLEDPIHLAHQWSRDSINDLSANEVDVSNLLDDNVNHLFGLDQAEQRFDRNTNDRRDRIDRRIQLVDTLQRHIEQERLKRPMTLEESSALVLEDIPEFEHLTNLSLTETDLRILSMERFASIERRMDRSLLTSEYRHLLQTDLPIDYIERDLLRRPLTIDERHEQEEFASLRHEDLTADLQRILHRRAELVDQYDIIHGISPSIEHIEHALNRSLTIAEKKRLTQDDYSMIERNADQTSPSETPRLLDTQHSTNPISESAVERKPFGPIDQPKLFDPTTEDGVQHRPTAEEIGADTTEKQIGYDQIESSSAVSPISNQAARFTLTELEEVLGRPSNSDELERFAGARFLGIEEDLDQSLSDFQRSNLLRGDGLAIEDLISRKLTAEEEGPHLIDVKEMEQILRRRLTFDELNRLEEMSRLPRRSSHHDALPEGELDRQKEEELQKLPIHRLLKDLDDDYAQRQLDQVQDEFVKRSSNDQRMERDSSVDSSSSKSMEPSPLTTDDSSPRRSSRSEPIKAFEHLPRLVEHIAEREYIEDATLVTEAMDQRNLSFLTADKSNWVSDLRRTSLPRLPPIQESTVMHPREDLYLGWTLFKGAERQELGLREVKPRMVQVKHRAKTFVVGIPEEYADARSRNIAEKIYRGESIRTKPPKARLMNTMEKFVAQVYRLATIDDATHFIVPSRTYVDTIDPLETFESNLIDIEDHDLQMRDSPETLEWYEECIQRNVQIHAQIPLGYQPSIVYCHTGRRTIITPARRNEQRRASIDDVQDISKTSVEHDETEASTLTQASIEHVTPSDGSRSQTVTDLILHTISKTQKTDLLEAMDELFSRENLDEYPMTETDWQEIFLILLNSYLRSHSSNRKDMFKRLTDKLHQLRRMDHRRSSGTFPSISITSPSTAESIRRASESDSWKIRAQQLHFDFRSPLDSLITGRSPNDSEQSSTPTIDRTSHESSVLPSMHPSTITEVTNDLGQTSKERLSETSVEQEEYSAKNANASMDAQRLSIRPVKARRYRIDVVYSDDVPPTAFSPKVRRKKPARGKLPPITAKGTKSSVVADRSPIVPRRLQ